MANNVLCYVEQGRTTSPKWSIAFADGCGGDIQYGGPLRQGQVGFWGSQILWQPIYVEATRRNRTIYYGDHGYFGQGRYYRVTRNARQHSGEGNSNGKRFRNFNIKIKDWRPNGSHILLCPPDQPFARLFNFNAADWITSMISEIKDHTDRKIVLRDRRSGKTLEDDFKDCWCVVTYVSNVAVDALIAGIPVFCMGQCASTRMGHTNLAKIEAPKVTEDRLNWLGVLADNQWTFDEMSSGMCWDKIGRED